MIANSQMLRRRWASGTDQLFAGHRFVSLFKELEVPPPSLLIDALATIAAAGPHTRLALTPRRGSRLWSRDAAPVLVHQLPDAVVADGSAAVLEYVRRRMSHHPLELHVSQRLLVLDIDHGLGDGRFALELTSALFAHSAGHDSPWVTSNDSPLALPRAIFHTFGRHPTRARAVLKYATELRSIHAAGQDAALGELVPWTPSYAVSVGQVDADAECAVNEWRRANAGRSGSAVVWLYIVRQALHAAGLRMTPGVIFAFDCRRYLPKRRAANGNFIIGLEVPLAVDEPLPTWITRLRDLTTAGVPLAGMAAVSARALLQPTRDPMRPADRRAGAPAEVMYTDMGVVTALDDAPWHHDIEPMATGLLDPAGPNGMTILNSCIGTARRIAISFDDNVFDRGVVDRALDYLKNPMRFLEPGVPHRPL